ncbi:Lead, cadmium, zinc and mercury transporting ATPase; Copper-translocating P-type ATPase [Helicobacter heilmannii]|uniref:heavy metal translocating P-type ATPase n=1 Tax=Helicobacter heilmannii TaxID=35817 RepID=UPI0006A23CDF|nr:heavy metal translocating P-type ATPase [Helicobacter heilmannii]CRF49757.1 Lead, cadmium, zinc and mercury transporting ATPase; Copper-translocating P-type ATPase [Helicobacter heilmannii]
MSNCAHCQLPCQNEVFTLEQKDSPPLVFCCEGCKRVYTLLHDLQLESFYDKLGAKPLAPIAPPKPHAKEHYSSKAFLDKFTTPLENGLLEVALLLENIHCAACVWLIEHVLLKQKGVYGVQANYTTQRAFVRFEPTEIDIATILDAVAAIGYQAQVYDPRVQDNHAKKQQEKAFIALVVGVFASMNIMFIAIADYAGYFSGMDANMAFKLHIASWALASLALFITGGVFLKGAFYGLKHGVVGMDLSVSVGALGVYLYSIYATFSGARPYFESVSMLITLVYLSKFLELKAKHRANALLDSLQSALPLQVAVLEQENGQVKRVLKDPQDIEVGALVEVLPGECVALDGMLESEGAQVSTQAFNGESLPTTLAKGQSVLSGCVNLSGAFTYRVSAPFKASFLSQMVELVQKSFIAKPKLQERADKLARYFSTAVLVLAGLSFVAWALFASIAQGFFVAMGVVVVACPCAFALATPIALVLGSNAAFKKGVLFKKNSSLESLAKASTLFLDKTGTLTKSLLKVQTHTIHAPYDLGQLLGLLWHNPHPIAKSLCVFLKEQAQPALVENLQQENGGLEARCGGHILHGGSVAYLESKGVSVGDLKADFAYSVDRRLVASFTLQASLKPKALEVVQGLKSMGLKIAILSGDGAPSVFKIAKELDLPCYAPLSPQQKLAHVQSALAQKEVVVMVGDGLNDTLSLARSQVSMCMHEGHDLSLLYSDIILLNNSLEGVQIAFSVAKSTHQCIKQNLAISALYNALFIPLALCGIITPLIAALGMGLSSLCVVANSFRLRL